MIQLLQKLFIATCILVGAGGLALNAQPLPCPVSTTSTVNAGNDTIICNGQTATLRASSTTTMQSTSSYSFVQPAYLPQPYNVGTPILLNIDDTWSGAIPIPFQFCFFGVRYTQLWIGSNGNITFTQPTSVANAYTVANPIPFNYSSYNNCILAPFFDMDPRAFGTIRYTTLGTAPCRTFVVSWDSCGTFPSPAGGGAGSPFIATQQIVLYESTHVVDINVKTHTFYTGSTSTGNAVLGIQNANATQAYAAPGKNNAQFNITNESFRFVPNGAPSTFYTWRDPAGAVVGTSANQPVSPNATTTYQLEVLFTSQCDSVRLFDNVTVQVGGNPNVDSIQVHNPTYCGAADGSLVLFGLLPNQNFLIDYNKNGVPQPQITIGSSASGTLTLGNLEAAIYNNIGVSTPLCVPGNRRGPYTLVNPRIAVDFTFIRKLGCYGIDSIQFTNTTAPAGIINYLWRFGDGNTSALENVTHAYITQANYAVALVADNGTCRDSVTKNISTLHPLDAFFKANYTDACQGQLITFKDSSIVTTQDGIAPTFTWDYGDGNTDIGPTVTHSYPNVGTYIVRLVVKDFVPCTDTFYRTIVVNEPPTLSFVSNPDQLCEGLSSLFTADYKGFEPTTLDWDFGDGTIIHNLNPIGHSYDSAGVYTVKLVTHYEFCPDTNYSLQVTVNPFPGINLGPDTSLCPNASAVTLRNLADFGNYPGATYRWSNEATTPAISVKSLGTYSSTINYNGCTATDSITIFRDCYLDVPNSFTPNGDGLNDYFLPRQQLSRGAITYKMTVYNRWGQIIFETFALNGRGWDGTFNNSVQPQGVYIYVIDINYTDGRSENYTGNVTLLR